MFGLGRPAEICLLTPDRPPLRPSPCSPGCCARSGKSSRVPQMVLEELGGPILCTQPRRLAVVSIAKRVAEELGTPLGGSQARWPCV